MSPIFTANAQRGGKHRLSWIAKVQRSQIRRLETRWTLLPRRQRLNQPSAEPVTTGSTYVEFPPDADIVDAELAGQTRVFACQIDDNTAHIALTFDKAISGVNNPSVHVINAESTLLDNLAAAELRLQQSVEKKSLAARLADARPRAAGKSHARKQSVGAFQSWSAAPAGAVSGESYHSFVGVSAIGRVKETQMVVHHFVDHANAITTP